MKYSAIAAVGLTSFFTTGAIGHSDGYSSNQELDHALDSMVSSSSFVSIDTIGTSLEGNAIKLITLAGSADSATVQPALLITAGIDARYLVSTEVAIDIAERILSDHSELLDSMTVYIIPRANPDGAARNLAGLTKGSVGNTRSTDDDRDRASGEDGAEDINGDGFITMMRRLSPPIEDPATHLADPDDPRLNIKPDSKEDQRASFTLYTEGVDNDGDGEINEDGFGSVDLNLNFMHRWPEYGTHAGRYPLSEPESLTIAKFVIEHDNLVNQPDAKAKDITGTAPKAIDANDAELYKLAGKLYTEATGNKSAPEEDIAGSFHAWLYAQRGIPSFAAVPWLRPEIEKPDTGEDTDEQSEPKNADESNEDTAETTGLTPSGIGDISQETIDELLAAYVAETGEEVDENMMAMVTPEMIEGFATQAGVEVQRIPQVDTEDAESTSGDADTKPKKKKLSEDAKWLAYFESVGIEGFVDWQPFTHPTLGDVEIGGFVPLARINPPMDQVDGTSEKLTEFIVELMGTRPEVDVVGPEVKELGGGL
jgi:zinc carboxypeptidase